MSYKCTSTTLAIGGEFAKSELHSRSRKYMRNANCVHQEVHRHDAEYNLRHHVRANMFPTQPLSNFSDGEIYRKRVVPKIGYRVIVGGRGKVWSNRL